MNAFAPDGHARRADLFAATAARHQTHCGTRASRPGASRPSGAPIPAPRLPPDSNARDGDEVPGAVDALRRPGSGVGSWGSKGGAASPCQTAVFNTAWAGLGTLRVPDSSPASAPDGLRMRKSRVGGISIPYTERPDPSGVNSPDRGDFPRVPAPSRSRIGLRRRRLHRLPTSAKRRFARRLKRAFDEARSSTAGASLDARAGSLSEEDSTILRIALLDQADSGLLSFGGLG